MDRTRRLAALQRERAQLLRYLQGLTPEQWRTPSAAQGWSVCDVVAHLGATTRSLIGPGIRQVLTSKNAEAHNDAQVATRRNWPASKVLDEFTRTSAMAAIMLKATTRRPFASLRVPIAELGSYPMGLTPSLLAFDWHVHLRHDIAPVLGHEPPPPDPDRMAAVLEWMFAGMEQMNRDAMGWVSAPLGIELTGVGGGTWRVEPVAGGLLQVTSGADAASTAAQIRGDSMQFPLWSTTRIPWRTAAVSLSGDIAYATRFLDSLNIV